MMKPAKPGGMGKVERRELTPSHHHAHAIMPIDHGRGQVVAHDFNLRDRVLDLVLDDPHVVAVDGV